MDRKCFVMMPFDPIFNGVWEHVLRPTVTAVGDECKRADDFFSLGPIMNDVLKSIREADYLIADLTGKNPNVFYELGIAHALDKPVILLTQQLNDVPIDLRHLRLIAYEDSAGGAAKLMATLKRFIQNLP
jgi:hypothetical protein